MARIPLQVASRSLDTGSVVSYPSGSPIGSAIEGLGNSIQNVAERFKQKQDQKDNFDATIRENEMLADIARQEDDAVRNAPIDGAGIHDSVYGEIDPVTQQPVRPGSYDTVFDSYMQRMPESKRGEFAAKRELYRMKGSARLAGQQYNSEQAYYKVEIQKTQNEITTQMAMGDPNDTATFDAFKQQGLDIIDRSGLPALEKDVAKANWQANADETLFKTLLAKDPQFAAKAKSALGLAPSETVTNPVGSVVDRIIGAESSGDPNAQNSRSSAGGLGGFIDSTWVATVKKFRPDVARGMSNDQIIELKKSDPKLARELTTRFTEENAKGLTSAGIPATAANTYLAHFAGLAGAKNILNAPDDTAVSSVLSAAAIKANPEVLAGKTVGQVKAWAASKMGSGSAQDLPIITKSASQTGRSFDPDLKGIKPEVLSRFKSLQNSLGKSIPVVSGFRDPSRNARAGGAKSSQHIHGSALDLDVSGMSQAERIDVIKQARAMGFAGIGVYENSIHIDTASSRSWGPSHGSESLPAWAREAVNAPLGTGEVRQPSADPRFANIPLERRLVLANQADSVAADRRVEQRGDIEVAVANAPLAIQMTGQYAGQMPSQQQFIGAYGEQQGAEKFNQFQAAVETSSRVHEMQTMPASSIDALVAEAAPTSSGNDIAAQNARYQVLAGAAKATVEAREADPAAYVQRAFPTVAGAWENATDPAGMQKAIAATVAAQDQLGIRNIAPLPKEIAGDAVVKFKDVTLGETERFAAVTDIFMATPDPIQRKAIFEQMVDAGLPDVTDGAFVALDRGDTGAARRLFQAAMTDISKLPGQAPFKPSEIDEAIERLVMADEQIGDIYYGMADGAIENIERAQRDSKLLANAVNLEVRKGTPLDAAVSSVAKDLYGDVKTVLGDGRAGAQILVPKDTDEEAVMDGLAGLMPAIETRLREALTVPADAPAADGSKAIMNAAGQNEVNALMSEGYFRNIANGYMFFLPRLGAVAGDDGEPLVFTMDDILAAGVKKPRDVRTPDAPLTDDDFDAFQKRMQQ